MRTIPFYGTSDYAALRYSRGEIGITDPAIARNLGHPITPERARQLVLRADIAMGLAEPVKLRITGRQPVRPESEAETVRRKDAMSRPRKRNAA